MHRVPARDQRPTASTHGGADRVLAVLKALGQHPKGARLESLSLELGSPKSSVHRALATLRRSGLVEQEERGHYRLGLELLRIAFAYYDALDQRQIVEPVLEVISNRLRETAHYAELQGDEVVYIAKTEPPGIHFQMTSRIGGRNPAHCTGIGKALLAFTLLDRDAVQRYVQAYGPLIKRTPRTLTAVDELHEDFEAIRKRGYSVDREESERGINCVAFPVFTTSMSRPSGAISITAVMLRTPLEVLIALSDDLRSLIEDRLGPTSPRAGVLRPTSNTENHV
jgi:IclR family acetate operon transcriptional repressor